MPDLSVAKTITPHPVAMLLSDEQKARVRAATFVIDHSGVSAHNPPGIEYRRCPLAVATGLDTSMRSAVYRALNVYQSRADVESFMEWADSIYSNPDDVYALLSCELEPTS